MNPTKNKTIVSVPKKASARQIRRTLGISVRATKAGSFALKKAERKLYRPLIKIKSVSRVRSEGGSYTKRTKTPLTPVSSRRTKKHTVQRSERTAKSKC